MRLPDEPVVTASHVGCTFRGNGITELEFDQIGACSIVVRKFQNLAFKGQIITLANVQAIAPIQKEKMRKLRNAAHNQRSKAAIGSEIPFKIIRFLFGEWRNEISKL